ncbi:AmmeMemoRadiSam system radical SAM enzyme [Candidatus Saganbacteria bacterium]|nr:AmmeMemoRadiSam system radical SAM enzyme [Candidatus Saganbacteria bacterium]
MKEALFYRQIENNMVHCSLCPWECKIAPDQVGFCGVRQNLGDKLFSLIYNVVSSIALDPIEKKPLYHFHPGTKVLSVGTFGCNMRCGHCQNWQISHVNLKKDKVTIEEITPEKLISLAKEYNSQGIAWTYNEPTIWFEYCLEGAKLAKKNNLYTVWVTNGYINIEPLDMIGPYLDAYRVDIKGFNNNFYGKLAKIRDFEPILKATIHAKKVLKMHVEIITNIIPTMNDGDKQLNGIANWIKTELGEDIPWHVTRFFPYLEYAHLYPTPIETLERAKQIGIDAGLKFVHIGNV